MSDVRGTNPQPCTDQKDTKMDWGVVITSITGVVITSITGVVITSAAETPVDCGILMSD
jgi:hypothetical protein